MTLSSVRIAFVVAAAAGLVAACSDTRAECKDTPHSVSIEVPLASPIDITKDPQVEATKIKARSKWEDEVKSKFGPEWAKWPKSGSEECGIPTGTQKLTCIAKGSSV